MFLQSFSKYLRQNWLQPVFDLTLALKLCAKFHGIQYIPDLFMKSSYRASNPGGTRPWNGASSPHPSFGLFWSKRWLSRTENSREPPSCWICVFSVLSKFWKPKYLRGLVNISCHIFLCEYVSPNYDYFDTVLQTKTELVVLHTINFIWPFSARYSTILLVDRFR